MSKRTKKLIRCGGIFLFILYMGMLVYFLFFAESYGRAGEMARDPGKYKRYATFSQLLQDTEDSPDA